MTRRRRRPKALIGTIDAVKKDGAKGKGDWIGKEGITAGCRGKGVSSEERGKGASCEPIRGSDSGSWEGQNSLMRRAALPRHSQKKTIRKSKVLDRVGGKGITEGKAGATLGALSQPDSNQRLRSLTHGLFILQ